VVRPRPPEDPIHYDPSAVFATGSIGEADLAALHGRLDAARGETLDDVARFAAGRTRPGEVLDPAFIDLPDRLLAAYHSARPSSELFAILRDHSLLGRPAREAADDHADAATKAAAFQRGIALALESGPAGVGSRLFTARSLYLTGELRPEVTLDYLSGLIVGEEVRGALAARRGESLPPLALIGDPGLCVKYHQALTACGVADARLLGDSAAAGIQQIALAAGLFPAGACDRPAASGGG
ncbi:hypothetical protein EBR56_07845, partial [bacterium]|nr:hypothetical protein [bacterium]